MSRDNVKKSRSLDVDGKTSVSISIGNIDKVT